MLAALLMTVQIGGRGSMTVRDTFDD